VIDVQLAILLILKRLNGIASCCFQGPVEDGKYHQDEYDQGGKKNGAGRYAGAVRKILKPPVHQEPGHRYCDQVTD